MPCPPLIEYANQDEYLQHYIREYCCRPVVTFDGIAVSFYEDRFEHSFYESSKRDGNKDRFSEVRARRIGWIKATLQDASAALHVGWDRERKKYDAGSRVAVLVGNYVVVIRFTGSMKAKFVTAYLADTPRTIEMIRRSPKWTAQK